jgi:hypothetical protein
MFSSFLSLLLALLGLELELKMGLVGGLSLTSTTGLFAGSLMGMQVVHHGHITFLSLLDPFQMAPQTTHGLPCKFADHMDKVGGHIHQNLRTEVFSDLLKCISLLVR